MASEPCIIKDISAPEVTNKAPLESHFLVISVLKQQIPGIFPDLLQASKILNIASSCSLLSNSTPRESAQSDGPIQQPSIPSTLIILSTFSKPDFVSICTASNIS